MISNKSDLPHPLKPYTVFRTTTFAAGVCLGSTAELPGFLGFND